MTLVPTTEQRQNIADGLSRLLADSYTLYLKTHNYHWNVTGPQFSSLHTLFEPQYTEASPGRGRDCRTNPIAWRVGTGLVLGVREDRVREGSERWLRRAAGNDRTQLVPGQEAIVRTAREAFPVVDESHDEPTADLLTQRMQSHEKNAWMLRSMLAAERISDFIRTSKENECSKTTKGIESLM